MYKHILIATDGSELAGRAATAGLALAKVLQARVTAVTATEPWSAMVMGEPALVFPIEEYEKAAAENAGRILSGVSSSAEDVGVERERYTSMTFRRRESLRRRKPKIVTSL
jgi:nucleotide-binding universal stress UspA family protein